MVQAGSDAEDPWAAQRRAIGAYIRSQRHLADLSLREFARLTSLSNAYLSQLERGRHDPSVRVLTAIAEALSVPVSRLLDPDAAEVDATGAESADAGQGADAPEGADAAVTADATQGAVPRSGPVGTVETIRTDPALTSAEKEALVAVYQSFAARHDAHGGSA